MSIDRVRRKLVNGFACTAASAAMLSGGPPSPLPTAFKVRKVADNVFVFPGRG
ncbi:hypothetical protein NKJ46_14605 [Mesorhizobium sp. M0166]|uniref:hypothetical protein n=1 Tax=unclassified Mesorhizobium TaxID=325217 RepID=UPI003338B9E6